jgi:hypothetical protein
MIKSLYNNNVLKLERRKIFSTKNFRQSETKEIFFIQQTREENLFWTKNFFRQSKTKEKFRSCLFRN